jgi:MFS family permease
MKGKSQSPYGWVIVGVSFATLALVYGVWYAFSVFFVALLKEFGWSRSVGAGAFSICVIISSIISPFVGRMVYSVGPKRVIVCGALILGVGLALCSLMQTWWQFYLFFSFIAGAGIGAAGWVPNIMIIQDWFKEKRGLATGIISSGIGFGILVCVPAVQYLIIRLGWRMAYQVLALFIPFIIISLVIAFLKKPPQVPKSSLIEIGISPTLSRDPLVVNEEWVSRSWDIRQAIRTKQFWLLGISFFLGNLITQSVFTHQVAFFVDHGMNPLSASYVVGLVGIMSLGGKILWGGLSDRIGREIIYTLGFSCSILSMILLISFSLFPLPPMTYFFGLFFALGYAVAATHPPLITADIFGGKAFGTIFGSLMIFIGIGGAFGAWFTGFIFDLAGSYVPAFVFLILCALIACSNIWLAAPRKIRRVPGRIRSEHRRIES